MAVRLPVPGADDNVWGSILNAFLEVSHNNDGTLTSGALTQAGAVTSVNSKTPTNGAVTLTASDLGVSSNVNYRGAWAASTAYAVDDAVIENGGLYICVTAHTSGSTFSGANWTQLSPQTGAYAQLASPPHGPVLSNMLTAGTEGFGSGAAAVDTSGSVTAVGKNALNANTSGNDNVAVGQYALYANTTGHNNAGVGDYALYSNTTGYANNVIGYGALVANTTGYSNFAGGNFVLGSNTTGYANIAIGHNSLQANTTGWYNSATGVQAMYSNTTGVANTGAGFDALFSNTTGGYNAALGNQSLYSNASGSDNTGVGYNAGYYVKSTGNTSVGSHSGPATGNNPSYAASLGYQAASNAPGSVAIGTDHTGTGAVASTQDLIQLGTSNHTTQTAVLALNTTQATLTGTTAGSAISSQPFTGASYKKFIVYLNGYENTTATAQTITFPVAFTNVPYVAHDDSGGATVSVTVLTLPVSMSSAKTGWVVVEGY